ncbi:PD-(D/E)XK nuclease family protein [Wenzhouxiangella sp. XN24]|uniref:PD-(D/E)XK nuclease family protein n=1 Tax=Wenzhouxiangella sp. XN24 TaxID=2713569 RepID=UPI0013ED708E|nr:hypothetical protein [Wenzhouxiangella sp. XN24]
MLAALDAGATIVTATRRLARTLQFEVARNRGGASWATPEIMPWSAWVEERFASLRDFGELDDPRPVLDEWQAATLWEEVFSRDPVADTLLMPGGAVESFREAWALALDWRLSWPELAARGSEDCQVFLRMARAYRRRLDTLNVIDRAQLPDMLAALLTAQGPAVFFAGFDTFSPAQQQLVQALGPRARSLGPPRPGSTATVTSFADSRAELAAVAAWARARLDAEPEARLGIVVPDLDAQAPVLEYLLDQALVPPRLWPGQTELSRPWNLSLGQPLVDLPVVAAAFLVFELRGEAMDSTAVSRLLRSPFLAGATAEAAQRARLERWLRQHGGDRISPARLLAWLSGANGAPACPQLAARMAVCMEALRTGRSRQRPSHWCEVLTRVLETMGWPGDGPVDSSTWQTVQAWVELLHVFSRLDAVAVPATLSEALGRLRRIGAQQRFQPETPEVPVQVLGLLETAGLAFDGLWVTGLHDGVLPAPLRPQPMLPAALQREKGMPRACPQRELELADHLVTRLAGAAPEVRFSHPTSRQDEPLRASPLVARLARAPDSGAFAVADIAAATFHGRRQERLVDERAPGVSGAVPGGSALLADQSACPFKAFATHRLDAAPMEAPTTGVDPSSRGSFVHLALSFLWGELRDRAGLAALDAANRARLVEEALRRAAAETLEEVPSALVRIEVQDAAIRIGQLLDIELLRPDFSVEHCERRIDFELGALRLGGRVDRIDRVAEGVVVLDYKTGAASAAKWRGERPDEPQMPLYALAWREELAGLAYASLKPGDVGLSGVVRSADVLGRALPNSKPPEDWAEELDDWRNVLENLASGFAEGDARVDPLDPRPQGTCEWCHLATLCRRDELLRIGALGGDASADASRDIETGADEGEA